MRCILATNILFKFLNGDKLKAAVLITYQQSRTDWAVNNVQQRRVWTDPATTDLKGERISIRTFIHTSPFSSGIISDSN